MPLFANKFTPKSVPVRRTGTSVLKKELGSDIANKELSLNLGDIKLRLGEFELCFEDGHWIPANGRAGVAHKENVRLLKELEQVEEENNMLRLKFEILLDMLTEKTVETEQAELLRSQSINSLRPKSRNKFK